jgi:hypothetical protein
MSKTITTTFTHLAVAVSTALAAGATASHVSAAETSWAGFVENATYHRKDVGISKFRNTAQAEFETRFETERLRSLTLNGCCAAATTASTT